MTRSNITNLSGSEVATLVNEEKAPGFYEVKWDGRGSNGKQVASAIYLYKLEIAKDNNQYFSKTKKMILMN